jgi:transketolase
MEDLTEDVIPLESLKNKWKSFGWVVKKVDRHNVRSLFDALSSILLEKGKPSCIIAKNVKGKGLYLHEGDYKSDYFKLSESKYKKNPNALNFNDFTFVLILFE